MRIGSHIGGAAASYVFVLRAVSLLVRFSVVSGASPSTIQVGTLYSTRKVSATLR
jgi:hypothetical protein